MGDDDFGFGGVVSGDALGQVVLSGDGTHVAFGLLKHWDSATYPGPSSLVRVYSLAPDGSGYFQKGADVLGDDAGDDFGYALDLNEDGSVLAVGALGADAEATGYVRAYAWRDASDRWAQIGDALLGDGGNDAFGSAVSLNKRGDRLAVGAFQHDGDAGRDTGHVRIYDLVDLTPGRGETPF